MQIEISESLGRQVIFFFTALKNTEQGKWLLSGVPINDFEMGNATCIRLSQLDYVFDAEKNLVKHRFELGVEKPQTNNYWAGEGQWTFQRDINFIREQVLGMPFTECGTLHESDGVRTWRSFDRWILRDVFAQGVDQLIFDLISSAEDLFPILNADGTIAKPLSTIFSEFANVSEFHDFELDSNVTKVIKDFIAASGVHQNETLKLQAIFQPVLSLICRRYTSHGVSVPFCMYDSDLMNLLFAETKILIEGLEARGFHACVSFGSVLGLVREGELLGHDCDVDIAIGIEMMGINGYDEFRSNLVLACGEIGFLVNEYSSDSRRYNFHAYTPRNGSCREMYFPGFDMFPIVENIENKKIKFYHEKNEIDWGDLFPAKTVSTGYGRITLPNKPVSYLDKQYGESWKIVKPFELPY